MFSIVLPIYNVEKYIGDCINSIIEQDYHDYEIILVDDGSLDNSVAIAESLLKDYNTIDYTVIHTKNRGVSAARNTGIKVSKGDYLIMIDSDDVLLPGFLSTYSSLIKNNPKCNIFSTSFRVIKKGKKVIKESTDTVIKTLSPETAQEMFFARKITFLLPTLLLNREFVVNNNIFFDEAVKYSEDVQYIWKCLCFNRFPVIHHNISNYLYILHSGSTMTASNAQKISTGFDGLLRLFPVIKTYLPNTIEKDFYSLYCFNLVHGAARLLKYSDFLLLCRNYNLKSHFRNLRKCSSHVDIRIKLVSSIALLVPFVGYSILKYF